MYIDAFNQFSDAQALTATAVSTNVIDLKFDGNLGIGEPMAVVVSLDAAADDADGNETYSVEIQFSSDEAFTSPVVAASKSITAGAAAGSKVVLFVPADLSGDRYMRLNYALGGTTPSVTVTAFLTKADMIDNSVQYPNGYTIS